ncbi:MAG: alpha/beta fold hydrolase, partial [Cyanobacteria bacterium J06559_1]
WSQQVQDFCEQVIGESAFLIGNSMSRRYSLMAGQASVLPTFRSLIDRWHRPGKPLDYNFETWSQQVQDFCEQVIGESAFLIGNSIGCVVALQAAVDAPNWVRGVVLLDCSLRLLHDRKRQTLPWYRSAPTPYIQKVLSYRPLIRFFFGQLAKPKAVKNILRQAYGRKEEVTDELVSLLLEPAFDPGAVDVFLAFISYSQGPIPEDLLPKLSCPALIVWGKEDPWEPVELARAYGEYPAVEEFIELAGVGHCPQDEAPEVVNPILMDWVAQKVAQNASPE